MHESTDLRGRERSSPAVHRAERRSGSGRITQGSGNRIATTTPASRSLERVCCVTRSEQAWCGRHARRATASPTRQAQIVLREACCRAEGRHTTSDHAPSQRNRRSPARSRAPGEHGNRAGCNGLCHVADAEPDRRARPRSVSERAGALRPLLRRIRQTFQISRVALQGREEEVDSTRRAVADGVRKEQRYFVGDTILDL